MITINKLRINGKQINGTLKWVHEYGVFKKKTAGVKVMFKDLNIKDVSTVFKDINREEFSTNDIIHNNYKVLISDQTNLRTFTQALVEIFAIVYKKIDE